MMRRTTWTVWDTYFAFPFFSQSANMFPSVSSQITKQHLDQQDFSGVILSILLILSKLCRLLINASLLRSAATLEVLVQKRENCLVPFDLVFLLGETMSFVIKDDILHHAALLFYGVYDVIGFRLDHARIIRSLQHDERPGDLVGMEKRGGVHQHLAVFLRVANFFVERLTRGFPVGRNGLERANPVCHSENVHTHIELLRLKGQRSEHHVTA